METQKGAELGKHSLHCSRPTHCLNHLCRPSANEWTKARSDIQHSHKDILSVCDRRVSYAPDNWPNCYVCVMIGCSEMSKFTVWRELARSVYSKQWKSGSNVKAFFWTKKRLLWEIPSRKNISINLLTGFPASSNHCSRIFCTLANSSGVKTNQEIMIFTDKKRLNLRQTHSYSGPGISEKTKDTNQLPGLKAAKMICSFKV